MSWTCRKLAWKVIFKKKCKSLLRECGREGLPVEFPWVKGSSASPLGGWWPRQPARREGSAAPVRFPGRHGLLAKWIYQVEEIYFFELEIWIPYFHTGYSSGIFGSIFPKFRKYDGNGSFYTVPACRVLLERGSQLSGRSGSRLGSTSAAAMRARATLAPATLPFCQDQSREESIKDKEAAGFRGSRRQR